MSNEKENIFKKFMAKFSSKKNTEQTIKEKQEEIINQTSPTTKKIDNDKLN